MIQYKSFPNRNKEMLIKGENGTPNSRARPGSKLSPSDKSTFIFETENKLKP